MLKAGVGLVFGSIFLMPANSPYNRFPHTGTSYVDVADAHLKGMRQLDFYHQLADEQEQIIIVGNAESLRKVIASHQNDEVGNRLLGIVPAFEGAAPIRQPEEAEIWYERGIRVVGLAWDDTQYAAGAWRGRDGLSKQGLALLAEMAPYRLIVDVTHMSEKASLETLDRYEGSIIATHSSARALLNDNERFLSDAQIRRLGERDGMIGVPLANVFLKKGHPSHGPKSQVSLSHLVDHIDHICQVLGDAKHVGIGSDLDGGFGRDDIPAEMDSVLDMPKISAALKERGYDHGHIQQIVGSNWVNLLRRSWQF